jgi:hypothetical protein
LLTVYDIGVWLDHQCAATYGGVINEFGLIKILVK